MSKRLQVVMDESELRKYRRAARRAGMTLSEWVRQELRRAAREVSDGDVELKLAAIRRAVSLPDPVPAPEIDQMLKEIEVAKLKDIDVDIVD
jgi:hypothetical protein